LRNLIGAQSQLMNPFAGIASSQDPDGVTAAGSTLRAALLMADNAVKQRAAQDFGGIGEALGF